MDEAPGMDQYLQIPHGDPEMEDSQLECTSETIL